MAEEPMTSVGVCGTGDSNHSSNRALGVGVSGDMPASQELQSMIHSTDDQSMVSQSDSRQETSSQNESSATSAIRRPILGKDDEYSTQFFGFTTKSVCNGIYNAYNFLLLDVLETWSQFVLQQFSSKCGLSEESMNAGCEQIQLKLTSKTDKSFDKLERYLEDNLFHIRDHVLLEEDKAHGLCDPTAEEDQAIEQEMEELTHKILARKFANAALREELKVVDSVQNQSDAILNEFRLLWKALKQSKVSDLRETFLFTLDRIHQSLEITDRTISLSKNTQYFSKENTDGESLDADIAWLGQDRQDNAV